MSTVQIIMTIVLAFVELILVTIVLMQSGSDEDLSGIMGGGYSNLTTSKAKKKTYEDKLRRITKILVIVLIPIILLLYMMASGSSV